MPKPDANRDRDGYRDGNGFAYCDGNSNGNGDSFAHCDGDCDSYGDGASDKSNSDGDSYCDCDHRSGNTDPNANGLALRHASGDAGDQPVDSDARADRR
jgi:hypothetical protein